MQLNENAMLLLSGLAGLFWYVWRGDRHVLKTLEEKTHKSLTKPECDIIIKEVKEEFKEQQKSFIQEVRTANDGIRAEILELRREIISILHRPWNGNERRG